MEEDVTDERERRKEGGEEKYREKKTDIGRDRDREKEESNHVLKVAIKCPYVLKHCATQEPTPAAENK